jgi:hypothetical protein
MLAFSSNMPSAPSQADRVEARATHAVHPEEPVLCCSILTHLRCHSLTHAVFGRSPLCSCRMMQTADALRSDRLFACLQLLKRHSMTPVTEGKPLRLSSMMSICGSTPNDVVREIAVLKKLDHPNIVKLQEVRSIPFRRPDQRLLVLISCAVDSTL